MSETSTLFELLSAQHRRRILLVLCESDSIQIPEGVQARGATQAQKPSNDRPPETNESMSLELQLVHNHLPKLQSEGLIEWDQETQAVTRGPRFETVEPALETLLENAGQFPDDLF